MRYTVVLFTNCAIVICSRNLAQLKLLAKNNHNSWLVYIAAACKFSKASIAIVTHSCVFSVRK